MKLSRKSIVGSLAVIVFSALAIFGRGLIGKPEVSVAGSQVDPADESAEITVKVIRPKRDPGLRVLAHQLATVEAFYQIGLKARVAGVVKHVFKDIGDRIATGELLVEIDVPELQQEVEQKEAIIEQRQQEWVLAQTQLKNAQAAIELAETGILQRKTEVVQAEAIRDFRQKRLVRFRDLATRGTLTQDVVDEQERDYQSSEAAVDASQVMVRKAYLDVKEKNALLDTAVADVKLKLALIQVAMKDRDRVKATADLARITAPFNGVVINRHADPGLFVQNSTTGNTTPLMTVARDSVVTVSMKLPDHAAAFVSKDTQCVIEVEGVEVTGRITRFSPHIDAADRTMNIEVDVYNGTSKNYPRDIARRLAGDIIPLGVSNPIYALCGLEASLDFFRDDHKGPGDPLPLCPDYSNAPSGTQRLVPGMTGYMYLDLDRFKNAYMLPSGAVFTKGGKPYILVVKDGLTKLVPVTVQVNDGRLAKVAIMIRGKGKGKGAEITQDLSGKEEVVISRQLEIGEGQRVKVILDSW